MKLSKQATVLKTSNVTTPNGKGNGKPGRMGGAAGADNIKKNGPTSSLPEFTLISTLGKGSFGTVFKVRRQADRLLYAMKKICIEGLSLKLQQDTLNEVRVLASLEHENIIRYHEAFIARTSLYMVMEFASHGDLHQRINTAKRQKEHFGGPTVCSYFIQIALGLNFLHSKTIIHRDIKPHNIFVCDGDRLKIGDLGCSKVVSSVCRSRMCISLSTIVNGHKPMADYQV